MFAMVLVPLDGSETSESIVPHVERLSIIFGSRVRLVHVCARPSRVAVAVASVDSAVLTGSPATEILRHAHMNSFDLIAMSTHGRSGMRRLIFGSTTEALMRASPIPMFVARSDMASRVIRCVLVLIDRGERGEGVVPLALRFAKAAGARLIFAAASLGGRWLEGLAIQCARALAEEAGIETSVELREGDPSTVAAEKSIWWRLHVGR